jgi:hypothetical protein
MEVGFHEPGLIFIKIHKNVFMSIYIIDHRMSLVSITIIFGRQFAFDSKSWRNVIFLQVGQLDKWTNISFIEGSDIL